MTLYIQPEDRIDCAVADNNCEGEVTRTNQRADWLCASHRGFAYVMNHQLSGDSLDQSGTASTEPESSSSELWSSDSAYANSE